MNTKHLISFLVIAIILSTDILVPTFVAANYHSKGHHGIELLLAAGILAKLLHKKGHHHHHHGHHHHGHHGSGSRAVEVMHAPPPMVGYQPAHGGAASATTFSSSVEYPNMYPAASHAFPVPQMPYGGPPSAAAYIGFEPQPMAYAPPMMPQMPQMPQA